MLQTQYLIDSGTKITETTTNCSVRHRSSFVVTVSKIRRHLVLGDPCYYLIIYIPTTYTHTSANHRLLSKYITNRFEGKATDVLTATGTAAVSAGKANISSRLKSMNISLNGVLQVWPVRVS